MGWEWKEEFVKHYAAKMMDLKYSPWWVGEKCAVIYDFLHHYHDEEMQTEDAGTS